MEILEFDPFDAASVQNTGGLLKAYLESSGTESFLKDESINIPLFASEVDVAAEAVKYSYDFDGMVVKLSDVSGIKAGLHHLFVGKVNVSKIVNHWHILKKHIDLTQYSAAGISALRKSVGTVLAYLDGGYFLNVSCITANPRSPHPMYKDDIMVKAHAVGHINGLFIHFANRLRSLSPVDLERPSIMKANLHQLGRMNVLHEDQKFVLDILNQSMQAVNPDIDMEMIVTITKFGQKDGRDFHLASLVDPSTVVNISYHVACNVRPVDESMDLLWSRVGIQEIVGKRGSLFPVYSMREACNFQSNIDNQEMDVDQVLRQVLKDTDCKVNFLQLYAVTPHVHEVSSPKHPVSRIITMCDLHIQKHKKMLDSHASNYVGYFEELSQKTITRSFVRLEAVFLVPSSYQDVLSPKQFFIESMMDNLFENVPVLLPFRDNENGLGLRHVVHPVATYLSSVLFTNFQSNKGMGGFESSWTSFQMELALEVLFFGRPLSPSTRQYGLSLGVSPTHPESVTCQRGFLGLSHVGSASVGESPPPLETWIQDGLQKLRVKRLFPLTDCFLSGAKVIGEELVKILLGDLYQRNEQLPIGYLKGPDRPIGKLVDCRTVEEFCRELCSRKAFGYPHTFGRAVDMVTYMQWDPMHCLTEGMADFKYFPKVKFWDENRNLKAIWNRVDFVELHKRNEVPSAAARASAWLGDVCAQIEELGLSYSRNLKKYREYGMPWLEACIERLPKGIPKDRLVTALVFLSCVGLVQNGDFVAYEPLRELERKLPVTQKHMTELRVLSPLLLIHSPAVKRFNESVPYKVIVPPAVPMTPPFRKRPMVSEKPVELPVQEEEVEEEVVERIEPVCFPASCNTVWTDLEISFVDVNRRLSHRLAYDQYVKTCKESSTGIRSFYAFRAKRNRLVID